MTGTLILKGQIYQTYTLQDPDKTAWIPEAELNTSAFINGTIQRCSRGFNNKNIRIENKSILLYPTSEYAEKMIYTADEKDFRIDPCRI